MGNQKFVFQFWTSEFFSLANPYESYATLMNHNYHTATPMNNNYHTYES